MNNITIFYVNLTYIRQKQQNILIKMSWKSQAFDILIKILKRKLSALKTSLTNDIEIFFEKYIKYIIYNEIENILFILD